MMSKEGVKTFIKKFEIILFAISAFSFVIITVNISIGNLVLIRKIGTLSFACLIFIHIGKSYISSEIFYIVEGIKAIYLSMKLFCFRIGGWYHGKRKN